MTNAASDLYETRRGEIILGFFKSIGDFSQGGWYGGDYRQGGESKPHLLRADCLYNDRYMKALFSVASDVLKSAYEDSLSHRYYSLQAVFNRPDTKKPLHKCNSLFPEVEKIISVRPEVKKAFETIFDTCKTFEKSVAVTPVTHGGAKNITQERHGLTQEQADQLQEALKTVWKAYPEIDPRISEGFDYVMSDAVARKTFTFPEPIGCATGYCFAEFSSDNRSDYRLAEMLDHYDGRTLRRQDVWKNEINLCPEEVSAIARQAIENLNKLQEFSVPVAERCLYSLLKAVYKDVEPTGNNAAGQILDNLTSGRTTIETEANKIRRGEYGDLKGGYTALFQKDDHRKGALYVANGAGDYLRFCLDIRSGAWFAQERKTIAALCAQKNVPGVLAIVPPRRIMVSQP